MEPEAETTEELVDGDDEEPEEVASAQPSGKRRASSSSNNFGKIKKVRIDAPAPLLKYGSEDVVCLGGAVVGKVFKVNIF